MSFFTKIFKCCPFEGPHKLKKGCFLDFFLYAKKSPLWPSLIKIWSKPRNIFLSWITFRGRVPYVSQNPIMKADRRGNICWGRIFNFCYREFFKYPEKYFCPMYRVITLQTFPRFQLVLGHVKTTKKGTCT